MTYLSLARPAASTSMRPGVILHLKNLRPIWTKVVSGGASDRCLLNAENPASRHFPLPAAHHPPVNVEQ